MTITDLQLAPTAQHAAEAVLAAYPEIVFTSGRRDARAQAKAMAANTIRYGVDWLRQTYKNLEMVRQLEDWIEANTAHASSVERLSEGFYTTLVTQQAGHLDQFPHCRGDAFDCAIPRYADGRVNESRTSAIQQFLERLPGVQLVLTREGALRVIHCQCTHAPVSVPI